MWAFSLGALHGRSSFGLRCISFQSPLGKTLFYPLPAQQDPNGSTLAERADCSTERVTLQPPQKVLERLLCGRGVKASVG